MTYTLIGMIQDDINNMKRESQDIRAVKYSERLISFLEEFNALRERVTELEKRFDASK